MILQFQFLPNRGRDSDSPKIRVSGCTTTPVDLYKEAGRLYRPRPVQGLYKEFERGADPDRGGAEIGIAKSYGNCL